MKRILLGVCGGSGSGKTTLAKRIVEALGVSCAAILSQDRYYIDQSDQFDFDGGSVNFDHPSAIDWDLMIAHVQALKRGESIQAPIYDFATHRRMSETDLFSSKDVILVDGTLVFSNGLLVSEFSHTVFIDVPESVRLERRISRDIQERGRDEPGVRRQFQEQVKPMHDQFVEPFVSQAKYIYRYGEDFDQFFESVLKSIQ